VTRAVRNDARERGVRVCGLSGRGALVCWLWMALAGLLLCAGGASAATGHRFISSVSEAPPGTKVIEPASVAVERSTGRMFMGDPGSGAIDIFSSAGAFQAQLGEGLEPSGVAVDESSGDVYVSSATVVVVFKPNGKGGYEQLAEWSGAGTPGTEFGELRGVAVDNSKGPSAGDAYVVDATNNAVDVFKPKPPGPEEAQEGSFLGALKGVKLEEPNAVAVDASSGKVYVADSSEGFIAVYGPSRAFEGKLTGSGSPQGSFRGPEGEEGNVRALAAEEGDLYVAETERHVVSEFNSAGEWIGWITQAGGAPLLEPAGVAVTPSGNVYVSDALLAQLDIFGPGVIVPDAQTGKASKIGKTSAFLNGVVNGEGKALKYHFEWGLTEAYGSETTSTAAGPGEEKVKAQITGLTPGQSYHFRLVTENENGSNVGRDREFETLPAVEGLSTGPVQGLKPTEATLTGSLDPNGTDAHYYFQWGTSNAYGNTSPEPPADAGSGKEAVEAKTTLTGLQPNTTYHYRLVGTNHEYGTTYGEDAHFTTSGPPRITSEAATVEGHEAATLHAKVNPDELESKYHFEYGESTAYGSEVPLGGASIPAGEVAVAESAPLSKLEIGTTYHYRVIASNSAGTTTGPDQTFQTVPPALIEGTSATEVSSSTATLQAQINPLGHDTTYYFQYGTQPCKPDPASCTNVPAAPGQDIGAGEAPVPVSQKLFELGATTTYHYRVLAINSLGTSEGPEHQLTTQAEETPFALADNRAWEMVSPPDKGAAPVEALTREGGLILASEDGNALTYVVDGALGEAVQGNRSPEMQQVLATRTAQGWSSQNIATPSSKAKGIAPGNAPEYQFFTPDLSAALVQPTEPGAEPPLAPGVVQATMYLRDDATGSYLPLVTEADTAPGTEFGGHIHFLSATADLTHVVIASEVALTGPGSSHGLYEWSGGQLRFVSMLPNGVTPAASAELGFYGAVLAHAISDDGSRIVWTNKEDLNTRGGHLYMRDATRGETIQLDAAKGVVEPEKGSAEFQAASADGSRVFFTDRQRLTADSTAEPGQGTGKPDLYECQITEVAGKLACDLHDLTVDQGEGEHANVQGFPFGASEDGTSVYLVAQGVLAGNENGNGEMAIDGKDNLYELHYDGARWSTTFIATLSGEDSPVWEGNQNGNTAYLTARVSPNGRYLAFMSAAPITGYDNIDANPAAKGARAEEVFLYDSATASLRCVSCNPSGARPAGVLDTEKSGEGLGLLVDRRLIWGREGHEHWLAGNIPGWTAQSLVSALFQSRYLSDEGRLYFNSPDYLVPAAENGKEDVYEYEPSGVGSCRSPSGGCVSLISGGSSDRESAFIEATPDGSNVFFVTESPLLPQDTDTAFDIYDARECTTLSPCLTPPAAGEAPCAETETCRPAPPAKQIPGGPSGTAAFSGAGNVVAGTPPAKHGVKANKAAKPLTQAQKLKQALRSCRKRYAHSKKRRAACERKARKRYGERHTKKKAGRKAKAGVSNGRAGRRGR
jgi:DNA-binding beta-propeller fold protein YncE